MSEVASCAIKMCNIKDNLLVTVRASSMIAARATHSSVCVCVDCTSGELEWLGELDDVSRKTNRTSRIKAPRRPGAEEGDFYLRGFTELACFRQLVSFT